MNNTLYLVPTFAVLIGIIFQWREGTAIRSGIAALRAELTVRIKGLERFEARSGIRLNAHDARFNSLEAKFDRRFDALLRTNVELHERVARVEASTS